jgi:protein-S-isoprenylcysteine O-methyltransferase Ste14
VMAIILFRIHDEEALVQKKFVVEWKAYCRISNWLIPFIWWEFY